jgi:hypothetical protein
LWQGIGAFVRGRPPVLVTTFRTELDYPQIVAYVAWFDHTRTALAFYPGRYEPPNAPIRGPMSVPYGQRWRLFATFNGGFTYIDGRNGSAINGRTYEPLKDGLATLIGYRDGRLRIKTWTGGPNVGADVAFARQSLPPIIVNGKLSPALNDSSQWGATLGNAVRVWRTGVGIDRRGNVIYAAANDQTVVTLAQILQRAGAVQAMQFDINPEWPSLITYRHANGLLPTKVVPNVMQPATRYLVPDDRDFFAVYRRLPGPVTVPFNSSISDGRRGVPVQGRLRRLGASNLGPCASVQQCPLIGVVGARPRGSLILSRRGLGAEAPREPEHVPFHGTVLTLGGTPSRLQAVI